MTATDNSLAHTRWECKYHVVFIPKYRKKVMFHDLSHVLGVRFRELALQKESQILEGHIMPDHVHMLIAIPPKYSVSQVIGCIKGKSAIWITRTYYGRQQNYAGQHFLARGYYVSTVGKDEAAVSEYIHKQEILDIQEDRQLGLGI